jgi:hypothetical protein
MPAPGFPANTLDSNGTPIWISELAGSDDPVHVLYVVRGLEPREAMETLGARPDSIRSCELPDVRPADGTGLIAAALGIVKSSDASRMATLAPGVPVADATLVAGRVGPWTFVYDDFGFTTDSFGGPLSGVGEVTVTSYYNYYADITLEYAVRGEEPIGWITHDLDLTRDLPGMPGELRAAFDAAGVVEVDNVEPGWHDDAIFMRVACAMAGLTFTLGDLRRIPLLATTMG